VNRITQLDALEILDSRGRPTLAVTIGLDDRVLETVSVPSGASTGSAEAKELRDQNKRYRGFGTRRAVANVCGPIAAALLDRDFTDQDSFDRTLIELDATPDKSHFGANAILATSLAFARAAAQLGRVELFEYFASLVANGKPTLPQLTVNLFSGGKHAFGQVAIQDVLVVPFATATIADSLAIVYEVYQSAADLVSRKYNSRALTANKGGLAPPFRHSSEMLRKNFPSSALKTGWPKMSGTTGRNCEQDWKAPRSFLRTISPVRTRSGSGAPSSSKLQRSAA
jgi:enolase